MGFFMQTTETEIVMKRILFLKVFINYKSKFVNFFLMKSTLFSVETVFF